MIVETQPGNIPIIISSGLFPGITIHGNYCKELEDGLFYARSKGYTIPDQYVLDALNVWILEMKDSGIWYKRDYLYNFMVNAKHLKYDDSSQDVPMDSGGFCNINYKDPYLYEVTPTAVLTGRIRFINKIGWWSDPSNGSAGHVGYLGTGFLNSSNAVNLSRNSNHFVVWRDDNGTAGPNGSIIYKLSTGTGGGAVRSMIQFPAGGTAVNYGSYQNILSSYTTNEKKGYWLVTRRVSTEVKLFFNGLNVDTKTVSSNGFTNQQHTIMPEASINHKQIVSFAACGSSLTDREISDDYAIWMNYYNKVKQ